MTTDTTQPGAAQPSTPLPNYALTPGAIYLRSILPKTEQELLGVALETAYLMGQRIATEHAIRKISA